MYPDDLTVLSQSRRIKASTPRSLMLPTAMAHQFILADIFKKILKRDASLFCNFKDGKFWDDWLTSAIATGNAQDTADVLDSEYSATSIE